MATGSKPVVRPNVAASPLCCAKGCFARDVTDHFEYDILKDSHENTSFPDALARLDLGGLQRGRARADCYAYPADGDRHAFAHTQSDKGLFRLGGWLFPLRRDH